MHTLDQAATSGQGWFSYCLQRLKTALCLWLACAGLAHAQTSTTEWGVIPLDEVVTMTFANQDLTKNFTDQYLFTLVSSTGTTYEVVVSYDNCTSGCGNATVNYAIYEANGSLVSDGGSAILASGDYNFQVKGTGMGSGNDVSYAGTITFNSTGGAVVSGFVSAVPEPGEWALMLTGACLLAFGVWRQRQRQPGPPMPAGRLAA